MGMLKLNNVKVNDFSIEKSEFKLLNIIYSTDEISFHPITDIKVDIPITIKMLYDGKDKHNNLHLPGWVRIRFSDGNSKDLYMENNIRFIETPWFEYTMSLEEQLAIYDKILKEGIDIYHIINTVEKLRFLCSKKEICNKYLSSIPGVLSWTPWNFK